MLDKYLKIFGFTWHGFTQISDNCYNNNGTYGVYMGDSQGTWELINNSYFHTASNGTRYTGTYRNGIITGSIINTVSDGPQTGTFKLIKK